MSHFTCDGLYLWRLIQSVHPWEFLTSGHNWLAKTNLWIFANVFGINKNNSYFVQNMKSDKSIHRLVEYFQRMHKLVQIVTWVLIVIHVNYHFVREAQNSLTKYFTQIENSFKSLPAAMCPINTNTICSLSIGTSSSFHKVVSCFPTLQFSHHKINQHQNLQKGHNRFP